MRIRSCVIIILKSQYFDQWCSCGLYRRQSLQKMLGWFFILGIDFLWSMPSLGTRSCLLLFRFRYSNVFLMNLYNLSSVYFLTWLLSFISIMPKNSNCMLILIFFSEILSASFVKFLVIEELKQAQIVNSSGYKMVSFHCTEAGRGEFHQQFNGTIRTSLTAPYK